MVPQINTKYLERAETYALSEDEPRVVLASGSEAYAVHIKVVTLHSRVLSIALLECSHSNATVAVDGSHVPFLDLSDLVRPEGLESALHYCYAVIRQRLTEAEMVSGWVLGAFLEHLPRDLEAARSLQIRGMELLCRETVSNLIAAIQVPSYCATCGSSGLTQRTARTAFTGTGYSARSQAQHQQGGSRLNPTRSVPPLVLLDLLPVLARYDFDLEVQLCSQKISQFLGPRKGCLCTWLHDRVDLRAPSASGLGSLGQAPMAIAASSALASSSSQPAPQSGDQSDLASQQDRLVAGRSSMAVFQPGVYRARVPSATPPALRDPAASGAAVQGAQVQGGLGELAIGANDTAANSGGGLVQLQDGQGLDSELLQLPSNNWPAAMDMDAVMLPEGPISTWV